MGTWTLIGLIIGFVLIHPGARSDPPGATWIEEVPGTPGKDARLVLRGSTGMSRLLAREFLSSWDVDVSFDATRALFAGRRTTGAREGIYQVSFDSGSIATLVELDGLLESPRYGPGGWIFFLWNREADPDVRALRGGVLHAIPPRIGADPERISFHPGFDRGPVVTPSGRLIFSSSDSSGLLSMRRDGTDISAWHEDHGLGKGQWDPLAWESSSLLARSPAGSVFRIPESRHYTECLPAMDSDSLTRRKVEPRPMPKPDPSLVNARAKTGEIFCFDALEGTVEDDPRPVDLRGRIHMPAFEEGPPAFSAEFPLAGDGSFSLRVPADRPFRFEVLDGSGAILGSMKSHIWLRPGEQRGCIGCHEPRGRAPVNRIIEALDHPPGEVES